MATLMRLIYVSEIVKPKFDSSCLQNIMQLSKTNNTRDGITGVLICDYSHFLQVIEGQTEKVSKCLVRIIKDERHQDFKLINAIECTDRYFANWAMEFKELSEVSRQSEEKINSMSSGEIEALVQSLRN